MEESTISIIINYLKEFIPANKGHAITLGIGMFIIGFCIALTAVTRGLSGELTYMALHPGTSGPLMLGGLGLAALAAVMKLPQE